ncbi:uncharacterized protein LOC134248608 [Saccostrea cucullata]|uniref:uncharacterized protein LOC134248608 n=1 Tax=Saccostrea cuccullata TaxID=36930 RepID=UPI002ECFB30B
MDPRNSAQDIMRCDLCETTIVQMHCDTCLVNLCRACVGDHISTDETMDHKVVKFQSRKTSPLYPRCASHEKERCEMYCRHCDIPVCLTCLASDQHLGHKLSKILQVVGERKEMIKKELNQLNDTIYPTYLDIAAVEQNRMSLPQNVACFRNEKFWTCGDSSTMALYDFNVEEHLKEGQPSQYPSRIVPLKTITTNSGNKPADITVSTSGDLIYTHYEDRTVNIVKNEKTNIEELIRLQNWKPQGIFSTFSGELLIIMESYDKNPSKQTKVARYSGSTEIQSIQFDDEGNPLFSSTGSDKYICEDRNLDICVTDCGAKAVVVVNQAGKMRFRYNGHIFAPKGKPFNPKGITTDSQGHILSCDETNCCVHIINENGQFLRYIHCKDFHPNGLCTDTDDNLFLTGYIECRYVTYKNHMKKIEYLH